MLNLTPEPVQTSPLTPLRERRGEMDSTVLGGSGWLWGTVTKYRGTGP